MRMLREKKCPAGTINEYELHESPWLWEDVSNLLVLGKLKDSKSLTSHWTRDSEKLSNKTKSRPVIGWIEFPCTRS